MFFGGSKGKNKDEGVRVTPDELRELEAFIAALRQRDFESEAPEFEDPRLRNLSAALGGLLRAHADEYLKMTQDINDVLLSATKASEVLAGLAEKYQKISAGVREDLRTVDELTSDVSGMSSMISRTAEQTTQGGATMEQAKTDIHALAAGNQAAGENLQAMTESMRHLSDSMADIDNLVNIINGIAVQTNLLSLNASIEAARAGDAGRGFAVVAENVRQLAEESKRSVAQIGDHLNGIRTDVMTLGEKFAQLSDGYAKNTESIDKTTEDADGLTGVFGDIGEAMNGLAPVAEKQAASFEGISASLHDTVENIQAVNEDTRGCNDAIFNSLRKINDMRAGLLKYDLPLQSNDIIDLAKTDHMLWLARVNQMMWGNLDPDPDAAADYANCRLGRWYAGEGRKRYGSTQPYRDLGGCHERFHRACADAIRAYSSGKKEKASAMVPGIISLSKEVLRALDAIKALRV